VAAGFLVLRQVDVWATEGIVLRSAWRATSAAVDELPQDDPNRGLLHNIAAAVQSSRAKRDRVPAIVALVAYARALEHDAEWALASDVYSVVVDYADMCGAADSLPDVFQRLGYCQRLLGDVTAAAKSLTTGRQIAEAQGNSVADLRLRLSESNLMRHLGNLPAAADTLDTLIADAASIGEDQIVAAARHGRAMVAYAQGDFERAAVLCYAASEAYDSPRLRLAVFGDLATCAAALGHRDLARRVNEIVYTTADVREYRWSAAINLLEDAAEASREIVFESYRRVLADEELPPSLLAAFYLTTGLGYIKLGRTILARRALAQALDVSTRAGLNQTTIQADEALAGLDAVTAKTSGVRQQPGTPTVTVWSPALDEVRVAITRLHANTVAE
jgi:tetratricopeptide (TPR) repeat protein